MDDGREGGVRSKPGRKSDSARDGEMLELEACCEEDEVVDMLMDVDVSCFGRSELGPNSSAARSFTLFRRCTL